MRQIRITLPQKNIEDFCRKWKISEMALFGSVLSEHFRPDSDIDLVEKDSLRNPFRRQAILAGNEVIYAA